MGTAASKLTVLFEDPFWIGLYERTENGTYEVCKIIFGAEPRDGQVYEFLLQNWAHLRFSPSLKTRAPAEKRLNPKRARRAAQTAPAAVGTKAQQALSLQRQQSALARRAKSREQREAEEARQFTLRQKKS